MSVYNDSTAYAFDLFEPSDEPRHSYSHNEKAQSAYRNESRTRSAHGSTGKAHAQASSRTQASSRAQASSHARVKQYGTATRSSAAPKREAQPEKRERIPIQRVKPDAARVRRTVDEKRSTLKLTGIIVFLSVIFVAMSFQISALINQYQLGRQIAVAQAKIEELKSENVRINSVLNGKTGIGAVETYATKILGMTKPEKSQITCFDLSGGDKVLYSSHSAVRSALSIGGLNGKASGKTSDSDGDKENGTGSSGNTAADGEKTENGTK